MPETFFTQNIGIFSRSTGFLPPENSVKKLSFWRQYVNRNIKNKIKKNTRGTSGASQHNKSTNYA